MGTILKFLKPTGKWKLPAIIISGIIVGLAIYILYVSKAASYLSDNPATCVNCHIMAPQYATWNHSSHREHANCNDCHVPHDNIFNKYYFKAKDGLRHAKMFTFRQEPQVIFIREEGKNVVQKNCVRCHENLITDDKLLLTTNSFHTYRAEKKCWECHREVPHGRVNSLSSTSYFNIPIAK